MRIRRGIYETRCGSLGLYRVQEELQLWSFSPLRVEGLFGFLVWGVQEVHGVFVIGFGFVSSWLRNHAFRIKIYVRCMCEVWQKNSSPSGKA